MKIKRFICEGRENCEVLVVLGIRTICRRAICSNSSERVRPCALARESSIVRPVRVITTTTCSVFVSLYISPTPRVEVIPFLPIQATTTATLNTFLSASLSQFPKVDGRGVSRNALTRAFMHSSNLEKRYKRSLPSPPHPPHVQAHTNQLSQTKLQGGTSIYCFY